MNKFYMTTIQGKRWVTTSLELVSTSVYKVNVSDVNFISLEIDGEAGSLKTTAVVIGDANYTYYLDEANQELQIRLDASDLVNKVNFVINHVLAFTNDHDLYWNIDPDSPNTRKILYQSRMEGRPKFSQSQENNLVGILSTSITDFSFDNTDQWFNQYFTKRDSFRDAKVKIWKCNELPSSKTPFYIGYISSISVKKSVVITLNDFLRILNKPLYSFDTFYNSISQKYAGCTPGKKDTPIARLYGRNSSFKTSYEPFLGAWQEAESSSMPEAICTNYNASTSTSVNRNWATGIIEDMSGYEDSYTISFTAPATLSLIAYTFIQVSSGQDDFTIGDTFVLRHSAVDYYCEVVLIGSGGFYTPQLFPAPIIGDTIKMHKISCMAMKVDGGVNAILYYGRDYTVDANIPGSAINITLVNDCERAIGKTTAINPASETLHYKMRNKSGLSSYSHGAQIKKILLEAFTSSELDVGSFDDADVAKILDLNFQVPFAGDSFITKAEMLQKLLSSSFGYLYVNSAFQIAYGNYSLPAAEDFADLTDIEIEQGSISHKIDYLDVYYKVKFSNNQFDDYWEITDSEARYLHGASNVYDFAHCCDVSSVVKPIDHFVEVANFFSTPKIISSFTIQELEIKIGQRKNLNSQKALAGSRGTIIITSEGDILNDSAMAIVEESEGVKFYSNSSGFLIEV